MANPFTRPTAVSGFNASPPSDDAQQTSSNQLTWQFHVDKLSQPLKTFIEEFETNANTAFATVDDASNLSQGELPDARLSTNVAQLDDASNNFTTDLQFGGVDVATLGNILGNAISSKATNYTLVAGDRGSFIVFTAVATATLLPAATAGAGWAVGIINRSTAVVTIDGDAAETINGATTLTLGPDESIILSSNGSSNWTGFVSRAPYNAIESVATNHTLVIGDRGRLFVATAGLTLDLPAAATAGAGYWFSVLVAGTGNVTIDPNGAETVNGLTTIVVGSAIAYDTFGIVICDGSAWYALKTDYASTSNAGLIAIATNADTIAGTNTTEAVTPDDLHNVVFALKITVNVAGTSTIDQTNAGASGWSIADGNQTGEAVITHSLGLTDVDDLTIVATVDSGADPGARMYAASIEDAGVNSFQVQVMEGTTAPAIAPLDGEEVHIMAFQTA